MDKAQFIKDIMAEIKEKYSSSIFESELGSYRSRYYDFYRDNILMHPTKGFSSIAGWFSERQNEFNEEFRKLGIKVKEDPIAPLHEYEHQLKETGMSRLGELEKKLNK
jgi:hypothetical protein